MIQPKYVIPVALLGAGVMVGMAVGWKLWKPKPPKIETYAAEITQKDGSKILEKKPQPEAKPAQEIPKGAKVERIVKVTVQPKLAPIPMADQLTPAFGSPSPVTVDLTLLRMPDNSARVIASSPDGTVISGVDIPVQPAAESKIFKWQAGASWNPGDRTYGVWATRSSGPLVFGAHVFQDRMPVLAGGGTKLQGQILIGVRF